MPTKLRRIISGGQTGADIGGLLAARELGIATGGTAPKRWLTEDGAREALLRNFGLLECEEEGYPARTKANVISSDGTLLVGPYSQGGTRLTLEIAKQLQKPLFLLPFSGSTDINQGRHRIREFRDWLDQHAIQTLNVAGNRESENPGIAEFTRTFLVQALREHKIVG